MALSNRDLAALSESAHSGGWRPTSELREPVIRACRVLADISSDTARRHSRPSGFLLAVDFVRAALETLDLEDDVRDVLHAFLAELSL